MLRNFLPTLVALLGLLQTVHGEIRPFNLLLSPETGEIHYVEGFLISPGFIDLGELRFFWNERDLDDEKLPQHDAKQEEKKRKPNSSSGGARQLRQLNSTSKIVVEEPIVDVTIFLLPSSCSNTKKGCDWTKLGIGKRSEAGVPRYCCSDDAVNLGLCQKTQLGHLIIDNDNFVGNHRQVIIPPTGDTHVDYSRFEEKSGSGTYVVAFANCNERGRKVIVEGKTVWKSRHGFLPGDLFGLMYFNVFLFGIYFVVFLWYAVTMKMYEDANIPIQNWVAATIFMGCMELFFKAGDLFVWNEDGYRFWIAFYIGIIMGVLKRGISRCLIVMVSLGWGVVRDDLGPVLHRIRFLGGVYVAASLVRDIFAVVAYTEVQKLSQEEEVEIFDIVTILRFSILLIDILFYIWIMDSLNSSMEYLESMGQTRKLERYLRLRCLLLFSILFAVMTSVFGAVNDFDQGIVDNEQNWVVGASAEMNYLFVLMAVAILWKPSPTAKDYAFVMELRADDDSDDDEGVIEMKSAAVPSAADDEEQEISFEDEVEDDDEEDLRFE